jgi:hypothetical protein
MRTLIVIEAGIILAALVAIWLSLNHDHEGDWVNPDTGEKFVITQNDSGWVATSVQRTMNMVRNHPFGQFSEVERKSLATYDRAAGKITWQRRNIQGVLGQADTTWVRYSSGPLHFLNWRQIRNMVKSWTVDGTWLGYTSQGAMIYLHIASGGTQAGLRNGPATETLVSELTPTGLKFVNSLKETFMFTWDGRTRGTLEINNGKVVMDRLDG